MQTIDTAELTEARRCRITQFRGIPATLRVGGVTVRGLVRSVMELKTDPAPRWAVTIFRDNRGPERLESDMSERLDTLQKARAIRVVRSR